MDTELLYERFFFPCVQNYRQFTRCKKIYPYLETKKEKKKTKNNNKGRREKASPSALIFWIDKVL